MAGSRVQRYEDNPPVANWRFPAPPRNPRPARSAGPDRRFLPELRRYPTLRPPGRWARTSFRRRSQRLRAACRPARLRRPHSRTWPRGPRYAAAPPRWSAAPFPCSSWGPPPRSRERAQELVGELVGDGLFDQHRLVADAYLPAVGVARHRRGFDRLVDIGIPEHDEWRLAPNSSDRAVMFRAAASAMACPARMLPVSVMRRVTGLETSAAPTSAPVPVSMLMTPLGRPASTRPGRTPTR